MLPDADQLPTIATERLRLRALTEVDVPTLFAIFGDPEVCRYWSNPPLKDLSAAQALLRQIQKGFEDRSLFQWGITDARSGDLVGTCTLAALSPQHRRSEIGFALAREVWGRGYLTEALPALVDFAFTDLDLHRLEADVDPRNERSIRLLERTGFRLEGHLRERYLMMGEVQDALMYGLLRTEWELGRP
ncbi:GNAT family N-acetyltransferase [soil metagenome]